MITGQRTASGDVLFSEDWPETCPVEWCGHRHGTEYPCDGPDWLGVPGDCLCTPCPTCRGYGVIVVGYDERANEDVERQCLRCDGTGQR